ncbi:MAG: hypothetical protein J2P57_01440 [Acidimicrobiaceae bacterium]|nr:hypothetical protein [Acidimicrobiaceae bacterium]
MPFGSNHAIFGRSALRAIAKGSAAALIGASCLFGAAQAGAGAATLPSNLAKFAHCPVDNPKVSACLVAQTSSVTFSIGGTTLSSTAPTTIQFGLTSTFGVVPSTDGTPTLSSSPIPVPGGLLGIPGAPSGGVLNVTATPQLVGTPTVSLANLLSRHGAGIVLPLDVKVNNPLLGNHCTIGTSSNPITLNLTSGTTNPPAPNQPISGATGKVTGTAQGVINVTGSKLVDNAFAVPGAAGCGLFGILDPIVNLQKQLPSAAGNNTAILKAHTSLAPASLIKQFVG